MPTVSEPGRKVRIYVDTNDDPNNRGWTLIGQQRDGTFSRGSTNADTTNKDDDGWESHEVTRNNWGVECSAVVLPNDPAVEFVKTKYEAQEKLWVQKREEYTNGEVIEGLASVEDFPDEFPDEEIHQFSLTFKGSGAYSRFPYVAP